MQRLQIAELEVLQRRILAAQACELRLDEFPAHASALRARVSAACDAGACTPTVKRLDAPTFTRMRLAPLRPDLVVFGPGPWAGGGGRGQHGAALEKARAWLRDVRKMADARGGRAVFRSCPRGADRGKLGCGNGEGCDEGYRAILNDTGWELLDAYRMTDELFAFKQRCLARGKKGARGSQAWWDAPWCAQPFTDNWHFQCDVYRELNLQLLGACAAGSSPAATD